MPYLPGHRRPDLPLRLPCGSCSPPAPSITGLRPDASAAVKSNCRQAAAMMLHRVAIGARARQLCGRECGTTSLTGSISASIARPNPLATSAAQGLDAAVPRRRWRDGYPSQSL